MTHASATLEDCLTRVSRQAPSVLARCIERVIGELQQEEARCLDPARRDELGSAWRELQAATARWSGQYGVELSSMFSAVLQGRRLPAVMRSGPAPLSQELSLVAHEHLSNSIEASRVAEQVVSDLEQPICELDALVSTAVGAQSVRAELNPLHPDVFAQALRRLVEHSPVQATSGALWMKHMALPLAGELQDIYASVTRELRAAGVQPAPYAGAGPKGRRVAPAPQPAAAQVEARDAPAAAAYVALSGEQIRNQLLDRFLHEDNGAGSQPLPRAYYSQVLRELAELHEQPRGGEVVHVPSPEYRAQSPVDRPARKVDLAARLNSELWGRYADPRERSLVRGRLRSEAKQVGQVFGLEIVRRVTHQVAQDTRLLAPVREAIIACEPVLLRFAMVDPRFFHDPQNPGRQLIERIAQRSFRYNDEFSSEFAAFFAEVNASLKGLNDVEIDSPEPVKAVLAGLETQWREQDRAEEAQRSGALAAVRFAESRQAEADAIAWEISGRPGLKAAPALVQDFLYGPWAIVLAHERLRQPGAPDTTGYWAAIDDLLWSVNRQETLRCPARLFERLPPLLATLGRGLATIGSPGEHQPFFEGLMKLHRPVLRLRRAKLRRDAASSGATVSALAEGAPAVPAGAAPAREAGTPWMAAHDKETAGFEETVPTGAGALHHADGRPFDVVSARSAASSASGVRPSDADALGHDETLAIVSALQQGDWVDLYSRERWRRAQLVWTSATRTLFMFVSHGGQPHSMTRRSCERLVRSRSLRPVARHHVVSRALEGLKR